MNRKYRKTVIAGNWKMNQLASGIKPFMEQLKPELPQPKPCEIVLCTPAVMIPAMIKAGKDCKVAAGGEDVSKYEKGAYTGEVSADQLADIGAKYCIVGHSERRQYHGESDMLINAKTKALLEKGIIPMTKSEVRAVSISKLGLTETAICWDIGAGTGSVAIEMALQARKGHVYAIERSPEAVALLQENQRRFSAENMTVVSGTAPEACASLPAPTHVFIGGNSGSMRQTVAQILQKNPSARIVANAIALETVAELTQCLSAFPFSQTETVLLNVSRDKQAGAYHLMLANNPVYIFTMQGKDIQ